MNISARIHDKKRHHAWIYSGYSGCICGCADSGYICVCGECGFHEENVVPPRYEKVDQFFAKN